MYSLSPSLLSDPYFYIFYPCQVTDEWVGFKIKCKIRIPASCQIIQMSFQWEITKTSWCTLVKIPKFRIWWLQHTHQMLRQRHIYHCVRSPLLLMTVCNHLMMMQPTHGYTYHQSVCVFITIWMFLSIREPGLNVDSSAHTHGLTVIWSTWDELGFSFSA